MLLGARGRRPPPRAPLRPHPDRKSRKVYLPYCLEHVVATTAPSSLQLQPDRQPRGTVSSSSMSGASSPKLRRHSYVSKSGSIAIGIPSVSSKKRSVGILHMLVQRPWMDGFDFDANMQTAVTMERERDVFAAETLVASRFLRSGAIFGGPSPDPPPPPAYKMKMEQSTPWGGGFSSN